MNSQNQCSPLKTQIEDHLKELGEHFGSIDSSDSASFKKHLAEHARDLQMDLDKTITPFKGPDYVEEGIPPESAGTK